MKGWFQVPAVILGGTVTVPADPLKDLVQPLVAEGVRQVGVAKPYAAENQVVQEVAFLHWTPLLLPYFGLQMQAMRVRVLQIPHYQCL